MISFDLMKYGTHALIGFAGIYAYDSFIDGKDNAFAMKDGYTLALSTIVADVTAEVITGFLPYLQNNSLPSMLLTPLLNGIVYMYLYDSMVGNVFRGNRNASKAFMVGSLISLLTSYLENPIASLFGYKHY
jgi:hypothetical protein